jgi:phenylacetate-CoA ligase
MATLQKRESLLLAQSERNTLHFFHEVAERVPAYKDFLKRAQINPTKIKTIRDFTNVPITDAKNYIAAYSIAQRCWGGKLSSTQLVATSSGTTGEPKFWPRTLEQEHEAALTHERLYKMYFQIDKKSTLILIGYPMGIYISGIATLLPTWMVTSKGYSVTAMSIGNNKAEILRAVHNLSDDYDQTILIGHPFFIKDVIESGVMEGIKWPKKNLGLMFCSGGFSEAWREYVAKKAGIEMSAMRIFNTYGSSEMLLMGYETPFSISIKRSMEENLRFLKDLTEDMTPPQLFQFDPMLRYIESINNELIFTSASGIPLVRFNIHDRGRVISLSQADELMRAHEHIRRLPKIQWHLPLVALWGRNDDTLKFHAVNIYPEHIKAGLMDKHFLHALTGKFVMRKSLERNMNERLDINVELVPGARISKRLEQEIGDRVIQKLRKVNLEYLDMSTHLGPRTYPRIILRPYQDPSYFKVSLKPRYIDRASK